MSRSLRFFGGPLDGELRSVREGMRTLRVPRPVVLDARDMMALSVDLTTMQTDDYDLCACIHDAPHFVHRPR